MRNDDIFASDLIPVLADFLDKFTISNDRVYYTDTDRMSIKIFDSGSGLGADIVALYEVIKSIAVPVKDTQDEIV